MVMVVGVIAAVDRRFGCSDSCDYIRMAIEMRHGTGEQANRMSDMCDDNRFELIEKYKKELIEATNIETAPDEMAVIDDILFRFWQMGWLDKLELPSAQPQTAERTEESAQNVPNNDLISRKAAIDAISCNIIVTGKQNAELVASTIGMFADRIKALPSAQPERIQNNAVHLCDSCQYTCVTCPSHGNDAVFGDGKGNNNICACNKYQPISAQPKRGEWEITNLGAVGAFDSCSECKRVVKHKAPFYNYCPNCGADMRGEQE